VSEQVRQGTSTLPHAVVYRITNSSEQRRNPGLPPAPTVCIIALHVPPGTYCKGRTIATSNSRLPPSLATSHFQDVNNSQLIRARHTHLQDSTVSIIVLPACMAVVCCPPHWPHTAKAPPMPLYRTTAHHSRLHLEALAARRPHRLQRRLIACCMAVCCPHASS
jgi:hypothetical protein